ncbi:MAG: amidohydrolase family protein [Candidatus Latescibacterota bacterium]|nr:amidohydrolase family protein [Candidatus Latescibacterota bacterium]
MATDLYQHIDNTLLIDTHEHLHKEREWVENGPDILQDLFGNYVPADLITAGATSADLDKLTDASDPDFGTRFERIRPAFEATRFTGYGEAVRILAHEVYGMADFSGAELQKAQQKLTAWRQPGGRHQLLSEVGKLDHVQTDDFCWPCLPDESGVDFFLYDLSWAGFCNGQIDAEAIEKETGVAVGDLASLKQGMAAIFAKYGPGAIAVKAQHAYNRTLRWEERSDADAEKTLGQLLQGADLDEPSRLLLGDWCWARGTELAIEYNLPFKIHTGYYAGNDRMPVDRIKSGNLCALVARYLDCRFVLMHIAYPYSNELVSLAKHYRNVYADLCWAWSIDPYSSGDFVRRFIHAAPASKLFAFGGDTRWPTSSAAYAIQSRRWLNRALQGEVDDGLLTEAEAIELATRFMRGNQEACFDLAGTRQALHAT